MKEITLRKTHRNLGITLALFLLLQGGSGLLLSGEEMLGPETRTMAGEAHGHAGEARGTFSEPAPVVTHGEQRLDRHGLVGKLHHSKGTLWNLYRLVVGSGLMAMLASGVAIFLKSRARTPQ